MRSIKFVLVALVFLTATMGCTEITNVATATVNIPVDTTKKNNPPDTTTTAVPVTSVVVDSTVITRPFGTGCQTVFQLSTPRILPSNAPQGFVWSVTNHGAITLSASGLMNIIKPGTDTAYARSTADTTKKASVVVRVTNTSCVPVQISVVLNPTNLVFQIGTNCAIQQVHQLMWEVFPAGTSQVVTFSFTQNGVISLGSSGLISPLKVGTATVVATSVADTSKRSPPATVTVNANTCISTGGTGLMSISAPAGTVMRVGTSQQLSVNTTAVDKTVTWSSDQPQFFLVNAQSGILTAFSAVAVTGQTASSRVCATLRNNPTNIAPACLIFSAIP